MFFLPVKVLGRVFRGKFIAGLRAAFSEGKRSSGKLRLRLRNSMDLNGSHAISHPPR
jgi:hypothetical protein